MKALSIKEPWVQLILAGRKTIETRTWNTSYRGDILICCSKMPKSINSGKAVCIAEIYDCVPMTKEHEKDACCKIYPKAKSWKIRNIRLIEPVPVKGKLGLFNFNGVPLHVIEL